MKDVKDYCDSDYDGICGKEKLEGFYEVRDQINRAIRDSKSIKDLKVQLQLVKSYLDNNKELKIKSHHKLSLMRMITNLESFNYLNITPRPIDASPNILVCKAVKRDD